MSMELRRLQLEHRDAQNEQTLLSDASQLNLEAADDA